MRDLGVLLVPPSLGVPHVLREMSFIKVLGSLVARGGARAGMFYHLTQAAARAGRRSHSLRVPLCCFLLFSLVFTGMI